MLTEDVDAAYAQAQALGYDIVRPVTTEGWGVRRFLVRAPTATSSTSFATPTPPDRSVENGR